MKDYESGPSIVVGADGSAGSERALRWAAHEARVRHGYLRVVLAWEPAYLASYSFVVAHPDRAEQKRNAEDALGRIVRAVFVTGLPADVTAEVIEGPAVNVLVRESRTADLLVLGAMRSADAVASSVGPVIRGCLNQAHCPVMIIGQCDPALLQSQQPELAGSCA